MTVIQFVIFMATLVIGGLFALAICLTFIKASIDRVGDDFNYCLDKVSDILTYHEDRINHVIERTDWMEEYVNPKKEETNG